MNDCVVVVSVVVAGAVIGAYQVPVLVAVEVGDPV